MRKRKKYIKNFPKIIWPKDQEKSLDHVLEQAVVISQNKLNKRKHRCCIGKITFKD